MANGIRTSNPRGFNKGRSSKFREGSRVRQTPEEGRRTYRPKRCGNNNKDKDNSQKNLNDKKTDSRILTQFLEYHIYQPLHSDMIWHKVNFKAEFNRFEFRVFLLLD